VRRRTLTARADRCTRTRCRGRSPGSTRSPDRRWRRLQRRSRHQRHLRRPSRRTRPRDRVRRVRSPARSRSSMCARCIHKPDRRARGKPPAARCSGLSRSPIRTGSARRSRRRTRSRKEWTSSRRRLRPRRCRPNPVPRSTAADPARAAAPRPAATDPAGASDGTPDRALARGTAGAAESACGSRAARPARGRRAAGAAAPGGAGPADWLRRIAAAAKQHQGQKD
jgi:hypothetical protein